MAEQTIIPEQEQAAPEGVRLFHWQTWVHVGPGAATCPDVDEGEGRNDCSNPTHFHGWCHVPNQIEHERCQEKAAAAKARRMRLLRDANSDAYEVLEAELSDLERAGDRIKEDLVAELTARDTNVEYREALRDIVDLEEGEDAEGETLRPFEHVYDDQRRFNALTKMPEDERDADEFASLERHLRRFIDLVKDRHAERMEPLLAAMRERPVNELVELIRQDRIKAASEDAFMRTYSRNEWALCTLRHPGGERLFADVAALEKPGAIAPEVYTALDEAYLELERAQNEALMAGNS